jgi:branched-chain amino acid aminotransferase
MKLWLNGVVTDAARARIDPADRGLLLGDGVFETLKVDDGQPHHLARHLRRLRGGAAVLGIALDWDDAMLADAVRSVAAANRLDSAAVRMTLTRGPGGRGVLPAAGIRPTLLVTAHAAPAVAETVSLIVADGTRRNEWSPLSRIKTLAYGDAILARQEAVSRGAEDAVMLNTQGRIAETSAANLFVLRDGRLLTPPVCDGALPGIARAVVMETLDAQEQTMTAGDLLRADAVLLTNSLGVRAATMLDGRSLGRRAELEQAARAALRGGRMV